MTDEEMERETDEPAIANHAEILNRMLEEIDIKRWTVQDNAISMSNTGTTQSMIYSESSKDPLYLLE